MTKRDQPATPAPFAPDEMTKIRADFANRVEPLLCPRCGKELEVGRPMAGGGSIPPVFEIRCGHCLRSVIAAPRGGH